MSSGPKAEDSHENEEGACHTAAEGAWGAVVWAMDAAGRRPALDFFSGLNNRDAAKVQALFERLAEHGEIRNQEKFKKLGNVGRHALFEFKSFQLRFLGGFAPGGRFLVAHGLRKKKDAHATRDLQRAVRILNEHQESGIA